MYKPSGPTGRAVTAQGHPRRIFQTAIERGNLLVAEATTRSLEVGRSERRRAVKPAAAVDLLRMRR